MRPSFSSRVTFHLDFQLNALLFLARSPSFKIYSWLNPKCHPQMNLQKNLKDYFHKFIVPKLLLIQFIKALELGMWV